MLAVLKEMKCGLENTCEKKKTQKTIYVFSRVRLFVTPWTVAHQAPLSMEFSRQ